MACSDRMTAAITSDGALFTWGDGNPGNLGYAQAARQFVPRQVAGGLPGQHATQARRARTPHRHVYPCLTSESVFVDVQWLELPRLLTSHNNCCHLRGAAALCMLQTAAVSDCAVLSERWHACVSMLLRQQPVPSSAVDWQVDTAVISGRRSHADRSMQQPSRAQGTCSPGAAASAGSWAIRAAHTRVLRSRGGLRNWPATG